jgi:hypothetical protein
MNEPTFEPAPLPVEEPKKSNKTLIIAVVVVLVLCCCCACIGVLGWTFGDQILQSINF